MIPSQTLRRDLLEPLPFDEAIFNEALADLAIAPHAEVVRWARLHLSLNLLDIAKLPEERRILPIPVMSDWLRIRRRYAKLYFERRGIEAP